MFVIEAGPDRVAAGPIGYWSRPRRTGPWSGRRAGTCCPSSAAGGSRARRPVLAIDAAWAARPRPVHAYRTSRTRPRTRSAGRSACGCSRIEASTSNRRALDDLQRLGDRPARLAHRPRAVASRRRPSSGPRWPDRGRTSSADGDRQRSRTVSVQPGGTRPGARSASGRGRTAVGGIAMWHDQQPVGLARIEGHALGRPVDLESRARPKTRRSRSSSRGPSAPAPGRPNARSSCLSADERLSSWRRSRTWRRA